MRHDLHPDNGHPPVAFSAASTGGAGALAAPAPWGRARQRPAPPPSAPGGRNLPGYWGSAWKAAVVVLTVLVLRVNELIPPTRALHPALLSLVVITGLFLANVRTSIWMTALRRREVKWMLIYCAIIIGSVPLALWKGGAFSIAKIFPYWAMIVFSMVLCAPTRWVLDRILLSSAVGAGLTAALILKGGSMEYDVVGGARLSTGGSYDPNDLGALISMMTQITLGLALRSKGKVRWAAVGSVGLLVVALLKTGSRGGLIGVSVALVVLLLGQNWRRALTLTLAIVLAVPLAWHFGPETFRVRAESMLELNSDYNLTSRDGRIETWKRGLRYWQDSPIIGYGAGNYSTKEGEVNTKNGIAGLWLTAHNTYVQVLVELGVIGLVGLLGVLWACGRSASRVWRRPPPSQSWRLHRPEVFAAFVSFVVTAIFLSHAYSFMLFFIVGLCALTARVDEHERAAVRGQQRGMVPGAPQRRIAPVPFPTAAAAIAHPQWPTA